MLSPGFSAVVLAAGRSSRMGSDKALLAAVNAVPSLKTGRPTSTKAVTL